MISPAIEPPAVVQPGPPVKSVTVPSQRAKPAKSSLPPIRVDWELWNNSKTWSRSQWSGGAFHALPFDSNNITVQRNGDVVLTMDRFAEAELQRNADATATKGFVQADITVPNMRSGVIASPISLYDQATGDEINIAVVGLKGLQLTAKLNGKSATVTPAALQGDLSGRRIKVGVSYELPYQITYLIDDQPVLTLTNSSAPGGRLPMHGFKAISSVWGYPQGGGWAGTYQPLGAGEEVKMTIHGYDFKAAPYQPFNTPTTVASAGR